jgi:hypothetical protein
VLVSLESVNNLGRAYTNYFGDTRVFLQLMQQALSGHSRGIVLPEIHLQPGVGALAVSSSEIRGYFWRYRYFVDQSSGSKSITYVLMWIPLSRHPLAQPARRSP